MTKDALREWMASLRWGIHALAGELGIHPSTVQRYRTVELSIPKVFTLALRTLEAR